MTDKTREALDAAKKAHDETFEGISHDCFHKGYQAATSAADARYLPVIENLVEAQTIMFNAAVIEEFDRGRELLRKALAALDAIEAELRRKGSAA
jgi:hypothetical protein